MARPGIARTTFRLKIVVLFLFLAAVAVVQSPIVALDRIPEIASRSHRDTPNPVPPDDLIDNFDKTIQERFITAPQFGVYRIVPKLVNPHLVQFTPMTEAEKSAVSSFESGKWDVGIYLFGRKVTKRTDTKDPNEYDIRYRLFNPIGVTAESRRGKIDMPESKKLAEEIKLAFVEFQKPGGRNENEVRFEKGKWTFVARPVRAANQSCLQCHKDYVITDRLGDGKFTVRERRIGDANGVLVYAFKQRSE